MLKWARAQGCPWDHHTIDEAASEGHLDVVEWAVENGCPSDSGAHKRVDGTLAAYYGHLAVLKWLYRNFEQSRDSPQWLESVCVNAALAGHVPIIEWALESGAEWKQEIFRAAAIRSRINVLDWAYRNKYPFVKDDTCFDSSGNTRAWCKKCFEHIIAEKTPPRL